MTTLADLAKATCESCGRRDLISEMNVYPWAILCDNCAPKCYKAGCGKPMDPKSETSCAEHEAEWIAAEAREGR